MGKGINVLSLFDGISCGQLALRQAGIKVDKYFSCEINKAASLVARSNFPDMISLGDITETFWTGQRFELKNGDGWLETPSYGKIDILMGGSPCQDISSLSSTMKGLEGIQSSLFYHFLRLYKETKPKYFLLENVQGKKTATKAITKMMGVKPFRFNSNLVSGQNRKRLYWTNIPVNRMPEPKTVLLKDILETDVDEKFFLKNGRLKWLLGESGQNSVKKTFTNIDAEKAG